MRRREFITLLSGATVTWPLTARAQQPRKVPTIGFLGAGTSSVWSQWTAAFVQRLRELGWVEGRNVTIEYRSAEGRAERYSEIATEFARLKVDVIVTVGSAVSATMQVTTTIPIVFAIAVDPLGGGMVASLAKPGGNVTGFSIQAIELPGKRIELLRAVVPDLHRLAVIANGGYPSRSMRPPRFRQQPINSASKSKCWKSGALRTSRLPSRNSRAGCRPFMCARMH